MICNLQVLHLVSKAHGGQRDRLFLSCFRIHWTRDCKQYLEFMMCWSWFYGHDGEACVGKSGESRMAFETLSDRRPASRHPRGRRNCSHEWERSGEEVAKWSSGHRFVRNRCKVLAWCAGFATSSHSANTMHFAGANFHLFSSLLFANLLAQAQTEFLPNLSCCKVNGAAMVPNRNCKRW